MRLCAIWRRSTSSSLLLCLSTSFLLLLGASRVHRKALRGSPAISRFGLYVLPGSAGLLLFPLLSSDDFPSTRTGLLSVGYHVGMHGRTSVIRDTTAALSRVKKRLLFSLTSPQTDVPLLIQCRRGPPAPPCTLHQYLASDHWQSLVCEQQYRPPFVFSAFFPRQAIPHCVHVPFLSGGQTPAVSTASAESLSPRSSCARDRSTRLSRTCRQARLPKSNRIREPHYHLTFFRSTRRFLLLLPLLPLAPFDRGSWSSTNRVNLNPSPSACSRRVWCLDR